MIKESKDTSGFNETVQTAAGVSGRSTALDRFVLENGNRLARSNARGTLRGVRRRMFENETSYLFTCIALGILVFALLSIMILQLGFVKIYRTAPMHELLP